MDDQVKIHGYRIELGEIESVLLQSGQVQQAVVLCKEDMQGNKRLVAYVVPAAGYERESALSHLRAKLPEYMVPGLLVELDSIPLSPGNGKADRRALLEMDLAAAAHSEYEAPEGPLETQLAAIWSDLLGAERVGRQDNFFQLGGDSLLAMRLIALIKRELDIEISIMAIFESKTMNELAVYLESLLFRKEHLNENNQVGYEL
jgi:acyl carrier protein